MPLHWKLRQPTEWVAACADRSMPEEFERMAAFVEHADTCFHSLLVRIVDVLAAPWLTGASNSVADMSILLGFDGKVAGWHYAQSLHFAKVLKGARPT